MIMICKNCGNEIKEEDIFCPKCGEKNVKEETKLEEYSDEEVSENNSSKKKKYFKIIAGAFVGILLVVAGGFWLKSSANTQKNNHLLYIKDNEIYFLDLDAKNQKTKPKLIAEKLIYKDSSKSYGRSILKRFTERYINFTSDGKIIFYPDKNEYNNNQVGSNLFFKKLKEDKSEAKKIDSEITKYFILDDASKSKIFYLKGKEKNFYQNDMDDNRVKIATDVVDFWVNKLGNNIVFITTDGDIYSVDATGNKDKIDSASKIVSVKDNLSRIYYIKDKILYCKNVGKDRVKIAGDVSSVAKIYDNGEIYFIKAEEVKIKMIDLIDDNLSAKDANIQKPDAPKQPYPYQFSSWQAYYRESDAYRVACNSYYDAYRKYLVKEARDYLRQKLRNEEMVKTQKTLWYYDGENILKVAEDFSYVQSTGDNAVIIYNNSVSKNSKKVKLSDIPVYSDIYEIKSKIFENELKSYVRNSFVAIKGKNFEFTADKPSNFKINASSTKIYFIDDYNTKNNKGELYEVAIENGELGKQIKVDSDVASMYYLYTAGNNSVVYYKNLKDNKADLYMDKIFIDSDVSTVNRPKRIGDSKKIVYYTDWNKDKQFGMLKIYDGEKSKKISSETNQFYILSDLRILYLDKFDSQKQKGDIYLYNGTDEKKLIDTDVTSILYFYK